jgi:hypothetical protein
LRESLTAFAILLILVLTAALVGPMLVDWTNRRAAVEQRLSLALGTPVKITGPIKLRLLPTPFLELGEVKAGGGDTPEIAALGARIELAPMALLQGQIRVVDAQLARPRVLLTLNQDGHLVLPTVPRAAPEWIRFERIKISNGTLIVHDQLSGVDTVLEGIDADADARSLDGPFDAAGTVRTISGRPLAAPINFHVATGIKESDRLKFKFLADSGVGTLHADLDGALQFAGGAATGFEGTGLFNSHVAAAPGTDIPWKVTGALKMDARKATYEGAELRAGADERALVATGEAELTLGPLAQARITMNARQFELDHLLAANGEASVPPLQLVERLRPMMNNRALMAGVPVPIKIDASIEMVTLGGESLNDVSSNLVVAPGKPIVGHLEFAAPGRTHIAANGALETGTAAHFSGRIEGHSQDVPRLEEWLKNGINAPQADVPPVLRPLLSFRSAAIAGDFEISAVAVSGRNLSLTLNRSKLVGALAFTRSIGRERPRLYADLTSDALDLDAMPDLSEIIAAGSSIDASIAFDARAVKVSRVGQGMIDAGHIGLKFTKNGDVAQLERFDIARLGGADLAVTGSRDGRGGKLDLRLNAQRLSDLADLLMRVAPGRASAALVARAAALSPAQINVHAEAVAAASGDLRLAALAINGTAGATKISGDGKPEALDPQAFDASLLLDSPEASQILRQLGFDVLALKGLGKGHVEMALGGRFGAPIDVLADATIAGVSFTAQGQVNVQGAINPLSSTLAGTAPGGNPVGDNAAGSGPAGGGPAGGGPAGGDSASGGSASGGSASRGAPSTSTQNGSGVADTGSNRMFDGTFALKTKDATPLGQMFGLTLPNVSFVLPLDIAGAARWNNAGISLPGLKGVVGGAQLLGGLNWRPTGRDNYALSGNLSFDRLALASLVGLALGPQSASAANFWPTQDFGAGLINPPASDVGLSAGVLDLGRGWTAHDARLKLGLSADRVSLDDMQMMLNAGRVGGHITLRRDGKAAAVSGHLDFDQLAIETPAIRAMASATLDIAGTGDNMNMLIAGLAGRGGLVLSKASLPHLDPAALGKLVAASEADESLSEEGTLSRALAQALDAGPLSYDDRRLGIAMATGVIRFDPIIADNGPVHAETKTAIDLRTWSIDQRTTLTLDQILSYWSGPPPSIGVISKGPILAPERTIDVAGLVNGLAARAISRESERIEMLDADIRERAFFNRRLKASDYQRQREQELNRFNEEEKRRQAEEDRRRAQDAATRAAAQPPQPAQPAPSAPRPVAPDDPSALRQ